MENNEFKRFCIKNCTSYHFSDIIKLEDCDFDNILVDEKSYENVLVYDISYKTLTGEKSLYIRFDKVNGFIRVYDRTRYLALFSLEKYNVIYYGSRYLIGLKSGITYIFSYNSGKMKIDSNDDLPQEEILTLHNFKIFITSVFIKD